MTIAKNEIGAMIKISMLFDSNSNFESESETTPRIIDHGLFRLSNFDHRKTQKKKEMVFYIMPIYEMELGDYLKNFGGLKKIVKIIDVVSKLVTIIK